MAVLSLGAAALGAGIGAAANIGSSVLQWGANRNLQEHQLELNRQYRQTNYQDVVADMKKAGINPGALQGSSVLQSGSAVGSPGAFAPQIDMSMINSALKGAILKDKEAREVFKDELATSVKTDIKFENMIRNGVLNKDFVVDENGRLWPIDN